LQDACGHRPRDPCSFQGMDDGTPQTVTKGPFPPPGRWRRRFGGDGGQSTVSSPGGGGGAAAGGDGGGLRRPGASSATRTHRLRVEPPQTPLPSLRSVLPPPGGETRTAFPPPEGTTASAVTEGVCGDRARPPPHGSTVTASGRRTPPSPRNPQGSRTPPSGGRNKTSRTLPPAGRGTREGGRSPSGPRMCFSVVRSRVPSRLRRARAGTKRPRCRTPPHPPR